MYYIFMHVFEMYIPLVFSKIYLRNKVTIVILHLFYFYPQDICINSYNIYLKEK